MNNTPQLHNNSNNNTSSSSKFMSNSFNRFNKNAGLAAPGMNNGFGGGSNQMQQQQNGNNFKTLFQKRKYNESNGIGGGGGGGGGLNLNAKPFSQFQANSGNNFHNDVYYFNGGGACDFRSMNNEFGNHNHHHHHHQQPPDPYFSRNNDYNYDAENDGGDYCEPVYYNYDENTGAFGYDSSSSIGFNQNQAASFLADTNRHYIFNNRNMMNHNGKIRSSEWSP